MQWSERGETKRNTTKEEIRDESNIEKRTTKLERFSVARNFYSFFSLLSFVLLGSKSSAKTHATEKRGPPIACFFFMIWLFGNVWIPVKPGADTERLLLRSGIGAIDCGRLLL